MTWPDRLGGAGARRSAFFVLYCALTLILFRALVPHLTNGFPHDAGDPVLSAWALWWNAAHVPFTGGWWDGLAFAPEHGSLAFSDHRVGLGLIASPILWLGGGPILAHNVVFLLSFPLCAIAAHVLARDLTGSDLAGLVAGVTFGFNPYRMDHLPHLELLTAWWLPVVFLALHRYLREGKVRWLVLFTTSLALQGLTGGYYFFFAAPLIAIWILWFVRRVRRGAAITVAWALSAVPLLPALLGYRHFLRRLDLHRSYGEILSFSADITGVLSGSPLLAVWRTAPALRRQEGDIYVGVFVITFVAGCAIVAMRRRRPPISPLRGVQVACLLLAVLFEAVALSGATGGWSVRVAGASISVHDASRPAEAAAALLAVAALTSATAVDAWRRRSLFAFYVGAAVLMWLFALGPVPTFLGERVLYRGPYGYLMSLPGFYDAFRVPARFAMMMTFALATSAALALAHITAGSRSAFRLGAGITVAAVILLDGWITALPVAAPPAAWSWPAETPQAAAVLELPMGGDMEEIAAVWRTIQHGRPVINGYSGYDPPHHRLLRRALGRHDGAVLAGVAEYGPVLVALDEQQEDSRFLRSALADAGAVFVQSDARRAFAMLPRRPSPGEPAGGALPIAAGSPNTGRFVLQDLTDGKPLTRWLTTGVQRGGEQVDLQLDRLRRVSGVVLSMGLFAAEQYPRRLRIETSPDGTAWTTVFDGSTSGLAFHAVLQNALAARLTFSVADVPARYLRLRQLDADDTAPWSISDITVLGR